VITFLVQRTSGAVESLTVVPLSVRTANAILAYWLYVQKLAVRQGLRFSIPIRRISSSARCFWRSPPCCRVRHRGASQSHATLSARWMAVVPRTLVPVIGIVQVGKQPMADRYSYIPSIGLFVLVAWGAADLLTRLRAPRPRRRFYRYWLLEFSHWCATTAPVLAVELRVVEAHDRGHR
jgi:hypothetical protein